MKLLIGATFCLHLLSAVESGASLLVALALHIRLWPIYSAALAQIKGISCYDVDSCTFL